ncbi:MAG: bifunctional adenosylcobinamide kinase/adenosylcobinamide-phosphate guanylyltransferase [Deltaproteobacteria bacterium]|nr:bifunctional adenosylcobinamide kinase/adenosylcobinamide-phosphate guanylyltransferase [Deltaproteobacteria bacterium]
MDNAPSYFRLALVLGGARSGKSRYGLGLAARCPAPRLFLATGEPRDAEMEARIEAHQRERGSDWATREVPLELAAALNDAQDHYGVIVVDCLTMWVSNLLLREGASQGSIQTACEHLLETLAKTAAPVVLISNEVGWGIVPDNPLARKFRDQAGWLHQRLAQVADLVVLVVAGVPMLIKSDFFPTRP